MLALERSSCCCSCWFGEHPTILVGVGQNAQVTKNRERRPLTIEFFITNWHVADHYRFGKSLGSPTKRYIVHILFIFVDMKIMVVIDFSDDPNVFGRKIADCKRYGLKKLIYLVEGNPNSSEAVESVKQCKYISKSISKSQISCGYIYKCCVGD
jgi:hypothetical protein